MEWEFKKDMDHIFDVIKKTSKVIKSCKNSMHIEGAYNYLANLEKYLTHFKKSKRQQEFCDKQILEFRKMLKVKRRYLNEFSN